MARQVDGVTILTVDEVRGQRQYQGRGADHPDLAAAYRHILLNGHYTFQSDGKMIAIWTRSWPGWIWSDRIFDGSGLTYFKFRFLRRPQSQKLQTLRCVFSGLCNT